MTSGLEVLDHGVEALGGGEVGVGDVHAVDHDGHLAVALFHGGLADQVPHVGHGGEDDPLVRRDADVVLVHSRYLTHTKYENVILVELYNIAYYRVSQKQAEKLKSRKMKEG